MTCKTCSGQGRWDDIPCTACGGTGGDEPVVTPLRTRAIRVIVSDFGGRGWDGRPRSAERRPGGMAARCVDALLAAGMLADPEECARTYSLISELVKAWRRARDVADGKPLAQRDGEALLMDALGAIYDLGGCDGTCGTTGQCVAKRIRAYLADDQEDTDA